MRNECMLVVMQLMLQLILDQDVVLLLLYCVPYLLYNVYIPTAQSWVTWPFPAMFNLCIWYQ